MAELDYTQLRALQELSDDTALELCSVINEKVSEIQNMEKRLRDMIKVAKANDWTQTGQSLEAALSHLSDLA